MTVNQQSAPRGDRYIDRKELSAKLAGRSVAALEDDVSAGRLPRPVKLGVRNYWIEAEVDAHLRQLRAEQSQVGETPAKRLQSAS